MSSKPGLEPDEEPSPLSAEAATTAVDAQPHVVDPTGIGARLRQLQDTSRGAQLSWQEYTGHEHKYQLQEAVPPKKVYNATIANDDYDQSFSLAKLRTQTRWYDKRYFDSFVPHDIQLAFALEESQPVVQPCSNRRSAICADVGLVSFGKRTENHFYVLGLATGQTGNQFSVSIAKDAFKRMHGWSDAPLPEESDIIATFPTPILDVKAVSNLQGVTFGIRTSNLMTLLQFIRDEDQTRNQLEDYSWQPPVHLATSDFGGNTISDFALNPYVVTGHDRLAVFLDVYGGIWRTRSARRLMEYAESPMPSKFAAVEQLRQGDVAGASCSAAYVTYGKNDHTLIIARGAAIRCFNLEVNPWSILDFAKDDELMYNSSQDHRLDSTILLLREPESNVILNMATPDRAWPMTSIRVICTATEVMWLDLDKPDIATVRHKHYRQDINSLALTSTSYEGLTYTFLWSRETPALTVYMHSTDGPVMCPARPYDLKPPSPYIVRSGVVCIHLPATDKGSKMGNEAIVLVESDANGTVFARELTWDGGKKAPRLDFKRLNATEPLSMSPGELKKPSQSAHFFMLYNRLFTSDSVLHIKQQEGAVLQHPTTLSSQDEMRIPLEDVKLAKRTNLDENMDYVHAGACTADRAVDATVLAPRAISRELEVLEATEDLAYGFLCDDKLLDASLAVSSQEVPALVDNLNHNFHCERFRQSDDTEDQEHNQSLTEQGHQFASEQVAVDLSLSRHVLSLRALENVVHDGQEDLSMSSYDRVADLPDISYEYFRPQQKGQTLPVTNAALALLSEWTLGADVNRRPAFKNPYSQQAREETAADKQLSAFKKRIAKGGEMSASQPMPALAHASKVLDRSATLRQPVKRPEVTNGQDSQATLVNSQRTQVAAEEEVFTQAVAPSSTGIAVPFSQVVPGVHGGHHSKKRKKRAGGF